MASDRVAHSAVRTVEQVDDPWAPRPPAPQFPAPPGPADRPERTDRTGTQRYDLADRRERPGRLDLPVQRSPRPEPEPGPDSEQRSSEPFGEPEPDPDPVLQPVRVLATDADGLRRRAGRAVLRHLPVLMRGVGFRRYWLGQTISITGDQVTGIALPLVAVLILHVRAAEMGVLTALVWLPSLLFAMSAGVLVERRGRRRVTMIAADVGRAVLMASIPIAYVFGVLTMWQLYVVAFCAGTLSVLFMVCDPAMFVGLVPEKQYVDGNSLLFGSRALASVVGPSLGGVLVQALTAPAAILVDAFSFLGSAFELSRIRPAEAPPAPAENGAFTAGMRFIRHDPVVGPSLASISVVNFFNFMFLTLNVLYATRYLHVAPGMLGLLFGAGAIGGLLGAAVTKRMAMRLGVGRVNMFGLIAFTAPLVLVPAASGSRPMVLGMLFMAEFISGFGVMALDITAASIYATVVPNGLRSRVSGAFQSVNYGTRPLGALVGGTLGAVVGVRTTLWIATIGAALGFLIMLPSGVPRYRLAQDV